MTDIIFHDCEYRYEEKNKLYCKNNNNKECDNCKQNIHLNCTNFNSKKDYCLKYFKDNISSMKQCQEKTVYNDNDLQRKWSN